MSETFTSYSATLGTPFSNATAYNYRVIFPAATLKAFGAEVRFRILCHDTTAQTCNGMSIGVRSGTSDDFASAPTRVTVGGANSWTMAAGGDFYTDWMSFDLNPSNAAYLVHMSLSAHRVRYGTPPGSAIGVSGYYKATSSDESQTQTVTGYSTTADLWYIAEIQVRTSAGSKRRWRFTFSANDGATYNLGLTGLSMMVGGVEQCSSSMYLRTSSVYLSADSGLDNLVDGSDSTDWATANSEFVNSWVEVEFSEAKDIETYSFKNRSVVANQAPRKWSLKYWDGSAWVLPHGTATDVDADAVSANWSTGETRTFRIFWATAKARWRLRVTGYSGGSGWDKIIIHEMEMLIGATDQCTDGCAKASTTYIGSDLGAPKAFDDSTATANYYSTNWPMSGAEFWLDYIFPSAKNLSAYTITVHNGVVGNPTYYDSYPTAWTFEYWDGTDFVVADTQSGITWSVGEKKTFSLGKGWKVCGVQDPAKICGVALPAKGAGV